MKQFGPEVDVARAAFVHESASLYGKVVLAEGASVWTNAVMRAEMHEIVIGAYSNIQDFVMVHVGYASPTIVGANCSITHHVTLHGCRIGDNCLIGINATIMDGATIGDNCIVAGHTIVNENAVIPPNSLVMGVPGKVVKTRANELPNRINAWVYHRNALAYAQGRHREWSSPEFARAYAVEAERLRAEIAARGEAASGLTALES
jgi:carbonic anhydrase/acetyltransferase-like protein (isoleucine patch superfamily)